MNSKTTLALVSLISATSASGCYATYDLTPRGIEKLNGFRPYDVIEIETKEEGHIEFSKNTELTFLGSDGAVAETKLSRIDVRGNILIGQETESGDQLYVDLSRMSAVKAEKLAVGSTILMSTIGTAALLAGSVLFYVAVNGL